MIYVAREITEVRHSAFTRDEALDLLSHTKTGIDPAIRDEYAALDDHDLAQAFGHEVGNAGVITEAAVARESSDVRSVTESAAWR
ncbi:Uncharacterised protein [Mycobacteroides abscessus subsp. abscessus]|uniref:hypothetical protein n=1 Tax=Mycobacteroides abscessus TaxID=36809 RepID=UPI00092706C1|nr:hypothetical protein [Mycobacteroides abscessus]SIL50100.1 Uncharacterised protein [Mycobacteroides abscessus subsp. abscessus]SLC74087.1 Uncharacterised protein [Mycobacteroides abscessus subsp. abscessus]